MGWAFGFLFCADIGLFMLDVVDYYIASYILFMTGIMQCFANGWVYEVNDILKKGVSPRAVVWYTATFWGGLIGGAIIGMFATEGDEWSGLIIFAVVWGVGIFMAVRESK
jgi:hypothetical protein